MGSSYLSIVVEQYELILRERVLPERLNKIGVIKLSDIAGTSKSALK
jgi:hypothetical protein